MLIAAKIERSAARRAGSAARSPFQTDAIRAKGRFKQKALFWTKVLLLALLVTALVVMGIALYKVVSMNPYFVVKNVTVTGTRMVEGGRLHDALAPLLTGNIFTRDLDAAAALAERNPWIESVSVRTRLPDSVEVAVTERRPVAAVDLAGSLWLVDEKGYLIEEAVRVKPQLVITGLRSAVRPGTPVTDPRLFDAYRAASLFRLDTAFNDQPAAVDVSRADKTTVHTTGGLVIKLGPDQEEWEEKFMEYLSVRAVALDFAPGFAGFDLSFRNQVVATMKEGGLKQDNKSNHRG